MKILIWVALAVILQACVYARKGTVTVSSPEDFVSKLSSAQTILFSKDMIVDLATLKLNNSKLTIPANTQIRGDGKKIIITNGVTEAYSGVKLYGIHFKHCWIKGKTDGGDCLQVRGTEVYLEKCTLEDGQDELINLDIDASVTAKYCKFLNHLKGRDMIEGADKTFEINQRVAHADISYSLFQNVSHLCFKVLPGSKVHIHNNIFKNVVNEIAKVGGSGEVYFSYNFYQSFPLNHQFVWSDVVKACIFSQGECLGLSNSCTPIKNEVVDGTGDKVNFNGQRCYKQDRSPPAWPSTNPQSYDAVAAQVATAGAPSSKRKYRRRKY